MTSTLAAILSGTFAYNANDGHSTETYDNNGNVLTSGGKVFKYDFENRLKDVNNGQIQIVYDGDGNRVTKTIGGTVTKYLVDDLNPTGYAQVVEELVGGAVQRTYTYGSSRISERQLISGTWQPSFYGYDGSGHVRLLTDASGTVTDTYDYDSFGNIVNSTGSTPISYLYRGEQFDTDLGLYYLRARYLNPTTGRFMTRDTYAGNTLDPVTLHKYLYANADPVNKSDPSGRLVMNPPARTGVGNAIAEYVFVLSAVLEAYDALHPFVGPIVDEIACIWDQVREDLGAAGGVDPASNNTNRASSSSKCRWSCKSNCNLRIEGLPGGASESSDIVGHGVGGSQTQACQASLRDGTRQARDRGPYCGHQRCYDCKQR